MPNTRFELAYNFQSRFDYERSILSAGYVLLLTPTNLLQLTLVPAEASVVRSFTSPAFEALLAQPQNIYLRGAFVPHVTLATRAVAVYGAAPNTSRRYGQVTAGLEGADNFLDLAYQIIKPEVEAGQRRLGTLPYFQYIKLDLDAKRGVLVGRRAMLAGRLWGGVGVPLGPLQSLPIERRYFAGGSNSIRAWQARTLGPGSYLKRKSDPDQFGEVHLEGSLEYRFARTGFFQPAVFVDAGNLWTLKERGTSRGPQTDFEFLGLARDIAIGGGLGLRFDFQFFLLRLDLGMKLRDPSYPLGDAWIGGKYFSEEWRDAFFAETGFEYGFTNLNLAIGLPF